MFFGRINSYLTLAVLCIFIVGCASTKRADQTNPNNGRAQNGANNATSDSGSHPNFKELRILSVERDDKLTSSSASKKCQSKPAGSLFIAIGSSFAAYFCLGSESEDAIPVFHFNYKESEVRNIYLGAFSDTVNGVNDYSVVSIYETDALISSECKYTQNSDATLKPGPLGLTVKKNDMNALKALESANNSGKGLCSNVYLVNYKDLTTGVLLPDTKYQKQFSLVKIYP